MITFNYTFYTKATNTNVWTANFWNKLSWKF